MRKAAARSLTLALRAWLNDDERNAERIAEQVIAKALAGLFAYFRLLLDLVDGKIRPTAEEEWSFEPDYVLAIARMDIRGREAA
jgi:hypothetical protein